MKQPENSSAGFSLIELMVALVLGLTVIGGAITGFGSASRSAELNQSMSQLQANARFALDLISTDIRMAGYQGCASAESTQLTISTQSAPFSNLRSDAVATTIVGMSSWQASLPDGYTPPTGAGAPVANTHLLQLSYASPPGYQLASDMTGNSSDITINGTGNNLLAGQLAVISNCDTGDLFKIDSITGAGNQRSIRPADLLAQAYLDDITGADSTRVMPFVSSIYYIGDTTRVTEFNDPVRSLYLQTYPYDVASNPPLELVEGVDQLQLNVGMWQADNTVRFVTPGDMTLDSRNISTIQIGLLLSSTSRYLSSATTRSFTLAGKRLLPQGTAGTADAYYPNDKRIRVPFTSTVNLRNRFAENRS